LNLNILGKDNIVCVLLFNVTICLNSIGEPSVPNLRNCTSVLSFFICLLEVLPIFFRPNCIITPLGFGLVAKRPPEVLLLQILLAKLTKNILRGVNFTNLKIPGDYIVKSKTQGVCLQLSQTLGGDYAF
jgi:hypothetical protein